MSVRLGLVHLVTLPLAQIPTHIHLVLILRHMKYSIFPDQHRSLISRNGVCAFSSDVITLEIDILPPRKPQTTNSSVSTIQTRQLLASIRPMSLKNGFTQFRELTIFFEAVQLVDRTPVLVKEEG